MSRTYDFTRVYDALKDFQRATVEHVAGRLLADVGSPRFLVADEVGLGKTLVATGVVARAIEHHLDRDTKRIDVIYICSNSDIARQNTSRLVGRLGIPEIEHTRPIDRITLLPRAIDDLKGRRINFLALTPGTSFDLKSSEGRVEERALLYVLLRNLWGGDAVRGNPAKRVFAGWASLSTFEHVLRRAQDETIDPGLRRDFERAVRGHDRDARRRRLPTSIERFQELRQLFGRPRQDNRYPAASVERRREFIGALRELLARTCINALEPDLVILDEFQRFKTLLDGSDPAAELAQVLFSYEDVRLLLLSATPYKMYTLSDEQDDDHYADLVRTLAFLMGEERAAQLSDLLREYRRMLLTLEVADGSRLLEAKTAIETTLREVMVRTERLAASPDRNGMLAERPVPALRLLVGDLRRYVGLEEVASLLDGGSVLDFWKAAPYLLNFMEDYQLDKELEAALNDPVRAEQLSAVLDRHDLLLPWQDVERYRKLDPCQCGLRGLMADVVESGAWRLLWLPPSLPYYALGGPFADPRAGSLTKRLVFSAWRVVPKVVATLVSYEVERRMIAGPNGMDETAAEYRRRFRPLLRFQRSAGRLTGMPVFALLYPSPSLAVLGDPLEVAATLGAATGPVSEESLLGVVRERIERALEPLLGRAPGDGPVDEAWYWAAPLLLDRTVGERNRGWWEPEDLASFWHEGSDTDDPEIASGWAEHVNEARRMALGEMPLPGRPPADLVEVIAELAVAAPGNVALRALARLLPGEFDETLLHTDVRDWAAFLAWAFRSLFNLPEVTAFLRGETGTSHRRDDAYWRLVLRYCLDGGLQAVLDEYAHVLIEALAVEHEPEGDLLERVSREMREALTLRTANYGVRELQVIGSTVERRSQQMRGRFAIRFGDDRAEEERTLQRQSRVRSAFNSPFWPFVLATTSVGQEGLDFHQYCHAVVHWNLPANPVDLEQREGRVHRYKGHAIRKNVAQTHRGVALSGDGDRWKAMFEAAAASRSALDNDLVPYWLYPTADGAVIERYVVALPLSREAQRLEDLRRSLAAYRLVFGQPRQEDLLAFLRERFDREEIEKMSANVRIDLSPPAGNGSRSEAGTPGRVGPSYGRERRGAVR